MKSIVFVSLMLIFVSCKNATSDESTNKELSPKKSIPEFAKNYFIGRNLQDVRAKYGQSVQKRDCFPVEKNACSKNKLNCTCFDVSIAVTLSWGRQLSFVVANDKVVQYFDKTTAYSYLIPSKVETGRNMFGDEEPDVVLEDKDIIDGFKIFYLHWKQEKGYSFTTMFCPMEKVAGKLQAIMPIRNCFSKITKITLIDDLIQPEGTFISKAKY